MQKTLNIKNNLHLHLWSLFTVNVQAMLCSYLSRLIVENVLTIKCGSKLVSCGGGGGGNFHNYKRQLHVLYFTEL